MKNWILYLILAVILVGAATLMLDRKQTRKRGRPDERITLRKSDKIPYGTWVAYQELKHVFPNASVSSDRSIPGSWDSLNSFNPNQALMIVSPRFYPSESEMETIVEFAEKGNHVFISAREFSNEAEDLMNFRASVSFRGLGYFDTLTLRLRQPPFNPPPIYKYPGAKYDSYLFRVDSSISTILGTDPDNEVNYIRMQVGSGYIYVHLAPIAFTNYFLLHKQNMNYYNNVLSLISPDITKVVWDEYFISKNYFQRRSRGNWLSVLMKQPAFRWGLWTAIIAVIIYVLLEMRRKQRIIPVIDKPKNESLDFVRTIGRLYYDKHDHLNLSRKMASYFLEHVRTRFKLNTSRLDENFIRNLHHKSGYDQKDIAQIARFITFIESATSISDAQLNEFYKQLETFYKNT